MCSFYVHDVLLSHYWRHFNPTICTLGSKRRWFNRWSLHCSCNLTNVCTRAQFITGLLQTFFSGFPYTLNSPVVISKSGLREVLKNCVLSKDTTKRFQFSDLQLLICCFSFSLRLFIVVIFFLVYSLGETKWRFGSDRTFKTAANSIVRGTRNTGEPKNVNKGHYASCDY